MREPARIALALALCAFTVALCGCGGGSGNAAQVIVVPSVPKFSRAQAAAQIAAGHPVQWRNFTYTDPQALPPEFV